MTFGKLQLIAALGGAENVLEIENCALRIRAQVRNPQLVDEMQIRQCDPLAVVCSGNYVQIVLKTADTWLAQAARELV